MMNKIIVQSRECFLVALLLGLFFVSGALAQPSPSGEFDHSRNWIPTSFGLGSSTKTDYPGVPFSFTYGVRPLAELITTWQKESAPPKEVQRTVEYRFSYTDPETGLAVRCEATQYQDYPAVEWVLRLQNTGSKPTPIIENLLPLDTMLSGASGSVDGALGDSNSAESFAPIEAILEADGPVTFAPNGGRSSDGFLPFFNVRTPVGGVVAAIGWSGQWRSTFEQTPKGVRLQAGMQSTHFSLNPGESVRTPRILLLSWQGTDPARGPNLFRQLLLAHYVPRRNGNIVFPPICGGVSVSDPDGSYEGPHVKMMPVLAARGYEVFWSDMDPQQWYPGGFPNGTGTWEPDPKLYPRGLKPIGEAAHAAGLGYLLWFEPERVAPGSRIDRDRPEWVARPPKPGSGLFRLDIPEARAWLTDYIDKQVTDAQLDWFRCDFNIEPLRFWRRNDPPDRQGVTEMKYIEGLYAMWDDLRARHPGLMIDNCASGGRRIDLETCSRSIPLWHSDLQCTGPHPDADQLQNGALSRWIPLHGCAVFDFEPSYVFRSEMTTGNIICASNAIGPECQPDSATEQPAKNTIALYRKIRPYMLGDFYPLFPHRSGADRWYGYQFHRSDLDAGVAILFRREKNAEPAQTIGLRGVGHDTAYDVSIENDAQARRATGAELGSLRVDIAKAPGSIVIHYARSSR